ncbi:hypothetical protein GCM10010324_01670 [Streptomyces hiroshimensis]|uniref:Uncharacterized protein n=1 Tax=Streptomyces hiroshimensis TaxID=66424 RepID=A0ABQ2Y336_9ACTN|nr:hypothetical protein GCM10010324_01670 [Streptomyces hiroshimensis]
MIRSAKALSPFHMAVHCSNSPIPNSRMSAVLICSPALSSPASSRVPGRKDCQGCEDYEYYEDCRGRV